MHVWTDDAPYTCTETHFALYIQHVDLYAISYLKRMIVGECLLNNRVIQEDADVFVRRPHTEASLTAM